MSTDAGRYVKPDEDEDWWRSETPTDLGRRVGGCCAGCPIVAGCALASDSYTTCPITGGTPPPPPPGNIPAQYTGPAAMPAEAAAATGGVDWSQVAGRGVETAVSAAFGFGWLDLATGLIERFNREDSEGNPVDWGRLQLKRNGLAILFVTCVPLGAHTAAQWVAHALHTYSLGAVYLPLGMALGCAGPVFAGQFAPDPLGGLCRALWAVSAATVRTAWRFCASSLGWIVTRPAIWAALCGLLIVTGRFLIHILTGA